MLGPVAGRGFAGLRIRTHWEPADWERLKAGSRVLESGCAMANGLMKSGNCLTAVELCGRG